jgi:hypothetical protein
MRREQLMILLPLSGLIIFILILYSPEFTSTALPVLSDLKFDQKTNLTLTFSIAIFAAIEGYATFKRAKMEENRHQIDDARNELEKAYGPLYTILNRVTEGSKDKYSFWLEFEERRKIDEIIATYPFMFSPQIYAFWQEKIRNPQTSVKDPKLEQYGGVDLRVYGELGVLINKEYTQRVKKYHELIDYKA